MKSQLFQKPKGLQRPIIQSNKIQQKPEFQKQQKIHSERRILRESRPHNGSRGGIPGETPRLLVGSPGQEQMLAILFFRIPMFHSLLQPFLHELPSGRRLHLLNQQIPASHNVLDLTAEEEHLTD
ncbi:hypothetical protein Bca4012_092514 [Brassica carinata]